MTIKIVPATQSLYQNFKKKLSEIYFESSANDYHEQFLNVEKEKKHLQDLIQNEDCLLAFQEKQLVGFLFSKSLFKDRFLPEAIKQNFNINECYYIAEMAIEKKYRHQGIGTQLIQFLIKNLDKKQYKQLFIASWLQNIPATKLYKKLGFKPVTTIQQEKIKKDQSGKFIIKKQYLVRHI